MNEQKNTKNKKPEIKDNVVGAWILTLAILIIPFLLKVFGIFGSE